MINLKIKDIVKTIIFLFLITFIIWNRVFREFSTKVIHEYIFNIYVVSWLVILFLYLICVAFILIFKYKISFGNSTGYFKSLYDLFVEYIICCYEPLLYYISLKIDLKKIIEMPISYIVAYLNYPRVFALLFTKVPSLLLSTVFFIEILFYHQIKYFYSLMPILLIPLIFNALLFIVDEISLAQIEYVTPHMTCKTEGNRMIFQVAPVSPNIPNALRLEVMQKSLTWLANQYQIFSTIKYFCDDIKKTKELYGPWILLYTSILYFISWSYILITIMYSLI